MKVVFFSDRDIDITHYVNPDRIIRMQAKGSITKVFIDGMKEPLETENSAQNILDSYGNIVESHRGNDPAES